MKFIRILKDRARSLKHETVALYLAYKDKRTPLSAKVMIILTVGYAVSPIDLIPDFIPVIGYLDDLIILPVMIMISIKLIPEVVMAECRIRARNSFRINRTIGYISAGAVVLIWIIITGIVIFSLLNK